ncbi:MAG: aspartyl/asparaginyl beta-hydroxylase domain-containing protein, partial [Bacteroidota bacterium]
YHLGIQIPQGDIGIQLVAHNRPETYKWKERKGVVFDDTLLHTAWNKTDETRILIFADILKPFTGIHK